MEETDQLVFQKVSDSNSLAAGIRAFITSQLGDSADATTRGFSATNLCPLAIRNFRLRDRPRLNSFLGLLHVFFERFLEASFGLVQ